MAKPIPSSAQQDLINASIAQKTAEKAKFDALIPTIDAQITDKTSIDTAFKDLFNWYNDSIIGKYDTEKKALNGDYIASPITNADVENVVNDPTNARLFPDPGNVDVKRIDEFDGTPIVSDSDNEAQHISNQATTESNLTSGFGGSIPTGTLTNAVTTTAITPASTTVTIDDTTDMDIMFAIGNRFILDDGSAQIAIEVTNFVENPVSSNMWDVTFTFLVSGSVGIGANIDVAFTGFTDGERSSKTSGTYQDIMDGLVITLETEINARIANLDTQLTARAANEDPDGSFASTDLDTSKSFLQNYLLTTDISDIGLSSLSSERTTRDSQVTARVSAINSAYTGQTENYYNRRYEVANDRAQIRRGSLTEINRLELSKSSFNQQSTDRTESIASLNGILP